MKPFNYYDLIEIFPLGGCAVCHLVARDVERYIDSHLYEYVNTPDTHAMIRASRGLCAEHSAHLAAYGASVLGIAILHSAVLDEVLSITAAVPASSTFARLRGDARNALAGKLEPERSCPACDALEGGEKQHVRALAEHVDDPRLADAYRASDGLCLPHFRMTIKAAPNRANLETLISIQTAIWGKLKAELDEFARKYDVNHADTAMGEEGDSWRRALSLVAGERDVFGLRRDKA
jgi:hypothetical protein